MIDRQHVDDQLDPGMADGLDLDVAVVGAGMGGLYTAYRLITGAPAGSTPPRVDVFELGDRIAGRLHSVLLPGLKVAGELGGMRYMESMAIVRSLIETVFKSELKPVKFSMGKDSSHYFYLRKQRFMADAWANAQQQKPPQKFVTNYQLNDGDVGLSASQLFDKVTYDVLMADPDIRAQYGSKMKPDGYDYSFTLTAQDWDAIKPAVRYFFPGPYSGMRVNDMGFWNLLKDQVSEEGLQFLADAGGYYSNTINWNAAEAFQTMVGDFFGPNVEYKTIDGGYDQVGYALAQAFLEQPECSIWKENGVVDVAAAPAGSKRRYQVTVANGASGNRWTVGADAVVLAMPRRSLELLDRDPNHMLLFDGPEGDRFRDTLGTTIIQQSMKILMGFEKPWWKADFHATPGESITDLPMRQCYYFGTDKKDRHSLFLGSYNDIDTVSFWRALERPELFEPRATDLVSQDDLDAISHLQAPKVMVAEAMNQVRELHGRQPHPIPDPYVTYYKDWGHDPFGGGYHAWDANISVADTMRYMRRPRPEEAIHVCGEAYSDQQGWAEGALCEAEKVLQEHFGYAPPGWLTPADYYLGW
jgi:monoamine oxidase